MPIAIMPAISRFRVLRFWVRGGASRRSRSDIRDEVLVERPVEIVARCKAPIVAGGAVVDIFRPGIDDALPLLVDRVGNLRVRKRPQYRSANLVGRWIEGAHVIG